MNSTPLQRLSAKKKKLVAGVMSGTSADGIDVALVEITGAGLGSRIRTLAFRTVPFPRGFRKLLLRNSDPSTARLDDLVRLDMLAGMLIADAVLDLLRASGRKKSDLDLVGSHGQTVHHLPVAKKMFGHSVRGTLQIGHPSVIAKRTGAVTVGDFRVADVAVGGSGAPLVPLFDFLTLRSPDLNRIALNIGGIANMTLLPRGCSPRAVRAFDTGPGNMLVDALMQRFYRREMDANGRVASGGNVVPALLRWLISRPYFRKHPPKSTGRETFGEQFIRTLLPRSGGIRHQDIVATVSELTPLSIYAAYLRFVRPAMTVDEVLVSGGGAHNRFMMDALARYFAPAVVTATDEKHYSSDAKEAICFALLANETIAGNPGNLPGATGARRQTVLGSICFP